MKKQYVGDANIRNGIKRLDKNIGNINETVNDLATSIIIHAAGPGNGDVSRALDLCKVVNKHRSMNVAFLIGFFRYFGNCNVNLNANDGAGKVSLIARDAKAYRGGFDPEGAKHNAWYEAFVDGKRAPWYAGPEPAQFQPMGIGDIATRMANFVKNTGKLLESTKDVNGKPVPAVQLTDDDRKQVDNALMFLERIANTLARHENVQKLAEQLKQEEEAANEDEQVLEVLQVKERAVA